MPELAHGGVDGRPIHLTWRDSGMNHVAGIAFDQIPDLRAGRGAGVRIGGKRTCLHWNLRVLQHGAHREASVALADMGGLSLIDRLAGEQPASSA